MTDKPKHKRNIASRGNESAYEKRTISDEEADRRAWAIVNKPDQSARKSSSGKRARPKRSYNEE